MVTELQNALACAARIFELIEEDAEVPDAADAYELEDGGIIYKDKVCILLGSEVETSEVSRNGKCGSAHNVCFFPHLKDIKGFSKEMSTHIKNITLSTQRAIISAYKRSRSIARPDFWRLTEKRGLPCG